MFVQKARKVVSKAGKRRDNTLACAHTQSYSDLEHMRGVSGGRGCKRSCIDVMQYVAYRSGCIRRNIVAPPEPEAFFRTCSVKNLSSATSFKIKKGRKPPRSTEVARVLPLGARSY